jgi:hypothetical protein
MSTRATSAEVGDPKTFTLAISLSEHTTELKECNAMRVWLCAAAIGLLGRAYIVAKAGSTKCLAWREANLKLEHESKGKRKKIKSKAFDAIKEKETIVLCCINMKPLWQSLDTRVGCSSKNSTNGCFSKSDI